MLPLWMLLQIVAGSSMPGVLGYMFPSKRDMAQDKELCTSPVCQNRAQQILSSLDGAVDPCEDFYAYACGKSYSSSFMNLSQSSVQKITGILDSLPEMTEAQNATEKVVMLYQACKRSLDTEKQDLASINKILNAEGYADWPLPTRKENQGKRFSTVEEVLLLTGTGGLFQVALLPSLHTNKTAVLALQEAAFQLTPPLNSTEFSEIKLERSTADELNEIANTCARIKAEIMEIKRTINNSEQYSETTFATVESLVPSFSLLKVINSAVKMFNVTLMPDDHVVTYQPRFFTEYLKFLAQQNPDDIYNCQGMNRAEQLLMLLPSTIFGSISNQETFKSVWETVSAEFCFTTASTAAAPVLTRLYVLHESDIRLRKSEALSLLRNIGKALYNNLQFTPWIDHTTRRRAILKLKNLARIVGFSDDAFNETQLELSYAKVRPVQQNDTLPEISVEFERNNRAMMFSYLRNGVEMSFWTDFKYFEVGAFYAPVINSMVILDGTLGGLYFQSGLPRYLNLGSIGSAMGHELTHGFDSQGRRFDETGKVSNWWSNYSSEAFQDKAACFVKQYGSIADPDRNGTFIDGEHTLGENIADNGGIRIAHKAFRTYELQSTEIRLPGLENFTSEQLFFISNALIWCGLSGERFPTYSPVKYRVNVPLQNMEEFSAAFRCKKGSHMRLGDHERCVLW